MPAVAGVLPYYIFHHTDGRRSTLRMTLSGRQGGRKQSTVNRGDEMKMYKLTGSDGGDVMISPKYLTASMIVEIVRVNDKTTRISIQTPPTGFRFMSSGGESYYYLVKETPAEILAMIGGESVGVDQRIAELEKKLKVQKAKFDVAESKAFEFLERMNKAESELAAIKAKPQEDTPLDRWRVMATAVEILKDLSSRIVANCSHTRRQRMAYDLAAMAIETANSSELSSKPYEVK